MIIKNTIKFIAIIISLYFSYFAFIVSNIFINDFIVNSYIAYERTKSGIYNIKETTKSYYEKSKIFIKKFINKEEAEKENSKYIQNLEYEEKLRKERLEKIEQNKIILSLFPYMLSFIIFLIVYIKVLQIINNFINVNK